MILEKLELGTLGANCYIIGDQKTREAAVIDPGGNPEIIMKVLEDKKLQLKYILLTHGHGDHIGGAKALNEMTNGLVFVHKKDLPLLQDKNKNYSVIMGGQPIEMDTDNFFDDGDILKLGDFDLKIIHTPGHTQGGVCIYVDNLLFSGDTLFANSIGRTDLDGGNYDEIIHSINTKLMNLPQDITVFPGHGPKTQIGIEKMTNPYVR